MKFMKNKEDLAYSKVRNKQLKTFDKMKNNGYFFDKVVDIYLHIRLRLLSL